MIGFGDILDKNKIVKIIVGFGIDKGKALRIFEELRMRQNIRMPNFDGELRKSIK